MPQLDTSTWFTIMMSSSLTLFIIMQLKIHPQHFPLNPTSKKMLMESTKSPWEKKWTKIYLPPLLPQQ